MTPLPTHISAVVINTVLDLLMPLLLAAARTPEAACQAAREMLADYQPQTAEELGLAAEIIAFRLKALSALRDASLPGTPNGPMLSLLKAANSLRRNQSSAQRKLDALRRARLTPPKPAAAPQPDKPVQAAPAPRETPKTVQPPRPPQAAPPAPRRTLPATAAEEALLSDEALSALLATYVPGARTGALNVPAAPGAPRAA